MVVPVLRRSPRFKVAFAFAAVPLRVHLLDRLLMTNALRASTCHRFVEDRDPRFVDQPALDR